MGNRGGLAKSAATAGDLRQPNPGKHSRTRGVESRRGGRTPPETCHLQAKKTEKS
jgi:hypothetical protein